MDTLRMVAKQQHVVVKLLTIVRRLALCTSTMVTSDIAVLIPQTYQCQHEQREPCTTLKHEQSDKMSMAVL